MHRSIVQAILLSQYGRYNEIQPLWLHKLHAAEVEIDWIMINSNIDVII